MAQKVEVTARTDYTTIPLNRPFVFTISIQYEGGKPENLKLPDFKQLTNVNVLNQWSGSQSSVSIVNGLVERTQVLNYNYQLQARQKGTLTIDSLNLEIQGKTYRTKPLSIVVTEEQKQQLPPTGHPPPSNPFDINPFFDSFFNNNPFLRPDKKPGLKREIKLQVDLSKQTVYEGEAIKVQWILLASSGSVRYEVDKNPKLKGFWKEHVLSNPQGQFLGTTVRDGVLYRKTLFDSMVLFPLRSGQLTIDPYSLRVSSIFGFSNRSEVKKSPSKNIVVKPLPLTGKKFFSGAVGNFKVQAFLGDTKARVNEPITYHIKFEGDGHPQFIKSPKIPFPSLVETYPPVEKSKFNPQGQNFKNYEIILIPKVEGRLVLPSFQISTFDPNQAKYIYHQIPSFEINVLKENQSLGEEAHFLENQQSSDSSADQLQTLQFMKWPSFFNSSFLKKFWLFFYICIAVLFLLLTFQTLRHRPKSAKEKLKEGLKEVETLIKNKKWKSSSVKLMDLVSFVLYQFDPEGVSSDWTERVKKLPPSFYERYSLILRELMRDLERLSFAPKKLSDKEALEKVRMLHKKADQFLIQLLD